MISKALAMASLKPLILAILYEGDSYGYHIIQRIQGLSDGALQWKTGTLYPFLHGLENDGLVESYWQAVENAPRRKYYKLTQAGHKALDKERQQWIDMNRILEKIWGSSTEFAWS